MAKTQSGTRSTTKVVSQRKAASAKSAAQAALDLAPNSAAQPPASKGRRGVVASGAAASPKESATDSHDSVPKKRISAAAVKGSESDSVEWTSHASAPLILAIREKLRDLGWSDVRFAQHLGVTPVYWSAIRSGQRNMWGLPNEKMRVIADLLEISLIQAYTLSGKFTVGDFAYRPQADKELDLAMVKMRSDPVWRPYAPSPAEWQNLPEQVKFGLVLLYERVYGEQLLKKVEVFSTRIGKKK